MRARQFLRFLHSTGKISTDYTEKIHISSISKSLQISSSWQAEELKTMLGAIDRNNLIGKRNYAVLLLACVLDLRIGDIKNLRFGSFNWEKKKISFIQHKANKPLSLPCLFPNKTYRHDACFLPLSERYWHPGLYSSQRDQWKDAQICGAYLYRWGTKKVFAAVDQNQSVTSECPDRGDVMPVFFRILYTSEMRVSELRLTRIKDISLAKDYITVHRAKNYKERIIPVHPLLISKCIQLKGRIPADSSEEEYFFIIRPGQLMLLVNIYWNFRRSLEKAWISHTGNEPRVHNFRHIYCVNLLRKWTDEGKDLIKKAVIHEHEFYWFFLSYYWVFDRLPALAEM